MNTNIQAQKVRGWIGIMLWVFGFNLFVALIAIDWGVGWAITLLCLRHVLIGVPVIHHTWRKIVVGNDQIINSQEIQNLVWPSRRWFIETTVSAFISFISLVWLNYPLRDLLF